MDTLVSVIIPLYNTEKYVRRCLESVISQSYRNMEIIVVDDGCTDGSLSVVSSFEDPRIRVIHHERNRGLFQARITGVRDSKGEFIAFVDSDDYVSCDWIRLLVKAAQDNCAELVYGRFSMVLGNGDKMVFPFDPLSNLTVSFDNREMVDAFMDQEGLFFGFHTVWNKLYSRRLWERNIDTLEEFSERTGRLIMTEDLAFSSALVLSSEKTCNIRSALYYYCKNDDSSTAPSTSPSTVESIIRDTTAVFNFFKERLVSLGIYDAYSDKYLAWLRRYGRMHVSKIVNLDCDESEKKQLISSVSKDYHLDEPSEITKYDECMYAYEYDIGTEFDTFEDIKRFIISDNCKVVSFDIFDTLVIRPFFKPTDIFYELNKLVNENRSTYMDFSRIRVNSEFYTRGEVWKKDRSEEITIDEIYDYIRDHFCFSDELLDRVESAEKELEIRYCYARQSGKELFELAQSLGKTIYFTTDMYLDRDTIESILSKNGYSGYTLLLSSEERRTKSSGALFKILIERTGTDPSAICHIGDNADSDVKKPAESGIASFHLPKPIDLLQNKVKGHDSGDLFDRCLHMPNVEMDSQRGIEDFIGTRTFWAMVANRFYDYPFECAHFPESVFSVSPYRIGYCALGMHLLAIVRWLNSEHLPADSTIHFVARDGYMPMAALEALRRINPGLPRTNYLYVSRKALLTVDMESFEDLYAIPSKLNVWDSCPRDLIRQLLPVISELAREKILEAVDSGRDAEKPFNGEERFYGFIKQLSEYKNDFDFVSNREMLRKEFGRIIRPGDVLFDIGYSGRSESTLSTLLGFPIPSYYIHTNSDVAETRSEKIGFRIHTFYDYKPNITGVIREHLMMKVSPSVVGYECGTDGFAPVFGDYSIDYYSSVNTAVIQYAALEFLNDCCEHLGKLVFDIPSRRTDLSISLEMYLHSCPRQDRAVFNRLVFEDTLTGGGEFSAEEFWSQEVDRIYTEHSLTPPSRVYGVMPLEKHMEYFLPPRMHPFLRLMFKAMRKFRELPTPEEE